MTRLGISSLRVALLVMLAGPLILQAQTTNPAPDFNEVYALIRAHLSGVTDTDLNRTAVQALISALGPKVCLVTDQGVPHAGPSPFVSQTNVFDGKIAYLRVAQVGDGLAPELRRAYDSALASNKLEGLVLDLRYAGGTDYAAAAATADLFARKEQPLLNWGNGVVRSKAKTNAITLPVAILVNRQTAGAAEALGSVMRETGSGLLLGSPTAGEAAVTREFALNNGARLRIATAAVQVGESTLLSANGVKPDISVEVSPEDERAYYADAYKALSKRPLLAGTLSPLTIPAAGTNRTARRPRFNEAELVRERREGSSPDLEAPDTRVPEPEKPLVRDPALARALDLLKGLAVVRPPAGA